MNRLWSKLTDAIAKKDMDKATEAKSEVEDAQREDAKRRDENNVNWTPRFFEQGKDGLWRALFK